MPSRRKPQANTENSVDPFANREANNYANPIASREHILDQLEEIGKPVTLEQFAAHLQIENDEQLEGLRRRLIAMSRDGQIISNRRGAYGLTAHMDLLPGKVQGTRDGGGYFIPDNASNDLYLNSREMARLFDGDKVLVRAAGFDGRGRREGTVVEILQRHHEEVVGRFYNDAGFGILVPDNKRINHEILIPIKKSGGAQDGQYVVAKIQEYPSKRRKAVAEITEVLGDVSTPGIEIDVALHSFDIPHRWPVAVKKETARLAEEVSDQDRFARHDLRQVPLVTIDGEDAKDFDDAVFAAKNKKTGGWTLLVAIADVSHYVKLNSALDEEAQNRGTSVYFPGHVIPMLPEKLSNGLCSLKPKTDRLAMVCEMEVLPSGEVASHTFFEAVIHSHARLTYNEVADMLQPPENSVAEKVRATLRKRNEQVLENLDDLYSLYQALRGHRSQSGAMDFDSTETRMVFGEDKKIREIVPVQRNDAHRLIEECMLCANVAAAQLLEHCELPALYRVHEGPNPDKLEGLREFLSEMGLYLGGGDEPTPRDYQQTLLQIAERPDRHMLQTMLIKSMMQAIYQEDNTGHFGLGFEAYTHFTSPIRRYPDLLVHRAIRYLVRNKKDRRLRRHSDQPALSKNAIYPYSLTDLDQIGEVCSAQERRADAAGYSVSDWLKCEYMQDHVGDEFAGTVTSVTSFGLFVELDGIYIEGLVHITELSNDYYHFDPVRHSLEGERSRKTYQLGDSVKVRVARVDLEEKKIDLQMLGVESQQRGKKKSSRRGKPSSAKDSHSRSAKNKPANNQGRNKAAGAKGKSGKPSKKKAGKGSSSKRKAKAGSPAKGARKKSNKKPGNKTSKARRR